MRDSTDPACDFHKSCDTRHGQSNMHGLLSCFLRVTTDLMIVLFRVPPRQMQNCPMLAEVVRMDDPARMASWKEQTPALIGRGQSGPAPPFNWSSFLTISWDCF